MSAEPKSLRDIISHGSPRTDEYESVAGKIKRGRKTEALTQIREIFQCNPEEALTVYTSMKNFVVGERVQMVEITLVQVEKRPESTRFNPFDVATSRYLARRGMYVGPLTHDRYGYSLNGSHIRPNEIKQIWKIVPEQQ